MKKSIYCLLLNAFMLGGLTSCFEDDGNYDYSPVYDINISGLEDSYNCLSFIDSINIKPQITPTDDEFDYFWGVYETNVQGYAPKLDTICKTKDLHWLVNLQPKTYKLVFCATAKNSGIPEIIERDLTVTTALSKGWYILRDQNGKTDLDFFSEDGKIEGIIAKYNDKYTLEGEAVNIGYTNKYKVLNPENGRYVNGQTIFALSSKNMVTLNLGKATIIRDYNGIFFSTPEEARLQAFTNSMMGDIYLMNAGKIHVIGGMTPNSGRFGIEKSGDYELADFCVGNFPGTPIFYDKKSSSFCSANSMYENIRYFNDDHADFPSNDMGVDVLFMGAGAGKDWALAKTVEKGKFQLMQLDPMAAYNRYSNLVTDVIEVKADKGITKAEKWATNAKNNIIYFAKDNKIYSCNIDAKLAEKEQHTLPADEKVTYLRNLTLNTANLKFDVLAVATVKGDSYKIYLFKIQAGNVTGEPEMMEGNGRVRGMIFIDNNFATALN